MLGLLTSSMPALIGKDEQGRDIAATKQYQENLKAYQAWFRCSRSVSYTILSCMQDDPLGEFERFPTAKDMWV